MKTVFPAGSTALILILLALIAQIRGCSMGYEIMGQADLRPSASEQEILEKAAKTTALLARTQPWFNARTILFGAGTLCGLWWLRNRMHGARLRPPGGEVVKSVPSRGRFGRIRRR